MTAARQVQDPADWFIFSDESGREADQQFVVIAALCGSVRYHVPVAEYLHRRCMETVPGLLRPGFVPHAREIQAQQSKTIRQLWAGQDRLRFLCEMMAVPRLSGMGIAYSIEPHDRIFQPREGYTREQILHGSAFASCMAVADQYVRDIAGPTARAQIFTDDIPEMRRSLALVHRNLQLRPQVIPPSQVLDGRSLYHGDGRQRGIEFRMDVANRPLSFASRRDIALLQLADFVAYGLLRHLRRLSGGDVFAHAIFGPGHRLTPPENCELVGALGPVPLSTWYPNPMRMSMRFGDL